MTDDSGNVHSTSRLTRHSACRRDTHSAASNDHLHVHQLNQSMPNDCSAALHLALNCNDAVTGHHGCCWLRRWLQGNAGQLLHAYHQYVQIGLWLHLQLWRLLAAAGRHWARTAWQQWIGSRWNTCMPHTHAPLLVAHTKTARFVWPSAARLLSQRTHKQG